MPKTLLLVLASVVLSLQATAFNTGPVDSTDRITQHYRTLWGHIASHICAGRAWAYMDRKSDSPLAPETLSAPIEIGHFTAHFEHEVIGPRSETQLTWIGTKVYSTVFYMDHFVFVRYDDLYPLLSVQERVDLETVCFLFRNTQMYDAAKPGQQNCSAALFHNITYTEQAHFQLASYGFLSHLVSQQVTTSLADSTLGLPIFLDKALKEPIELWKATDRDVFQIADKRFPGEFKDSVVINTYGLYNLQLRFRGRIVYIRCTTGETIYCRYEDFLRALPQWCRPFLRIMYDL